MVVMYICEDTLLVSLFYLSFIYGLVGSRRGSNKIYQLSSVSRINIVSIPHHSHCCKNATKFSRQGALVHVRSVYY